MTGGSNKRASLAALIAAKPGCRPRLIYRVHHSRRGKYQREGFTETGYARLLDAAHRPQRRFRHVFGMSGPASFIRRRRAALA